MRGKPYGKDIKEEIIKLHLDQKQTIASLSEEYGISPSTISRWLITFKNIECRRNNQCRVKL